MRSNTGNYDHSFQGTKCDHQRREDRIEHFPRSMRSIRADKLHTKHSLRRSETVPLDSLRRHLLPYFFYLSRKCCKMWRFRSDCRVLAYRPYSFGSRYPARKIPQGTRCRYYFFQRPCQTSQEYKECTKRCHDRFEQTQWGRPCKLCLFQSCLRTFRTSSWCTPWHLWYTIVSFPVSTESTATSPQLPGTIQAHRPHTRAGHLFEPASLENNLCTCRALSHPGTCQGYMKCTTMNCVRPGFSPWNSSDTKSMCWSKQCICRPRNLYRVTFESGLGISPGCKANKRRSPPIPGESLSDMHCRTPVLPPSPTCQEGNQRNRHSL